MCRKYSLWNQTANQRRTDSTASASVTMIMESWRACFSIQQYKWKTAWVGRRRLRKRSQKHAHLHFKKHKTQKILQKWIKNISGKTGWHAWHCSPAHISPKIRIYFYSSLKKVTYMSYAGKPVHKCRYIWHIPVQKSAGIR